MGRTRKTGAFEAFAFLRKKRFIDVASTVIAALLGAGAILSFVVAIARPHASVPFSAVGSLLAFCCGGVAGVAVWYGKLVRFEEYTPAHALATGYVGNFLAPVTAKLVERRTPAALRKKFFFVYLPEGLNPSAQDTTKRLTAKVKAAGSHCENAPLRMDDGTMRHVDAVVDDASGRVRYLDVPRTLATLADFVHYKMPARADSFDKEAKKALERKYIAEFRGELEALIEDDELLKTYVGFLDPPGFDAWLKGTSGQGNSVQ